MDSRHLTELRLKESTYWWHVNRYHLVLKYLNKKNVTEGRILEVGCGGGHLSYTIARQGKKIVSSDILFDAARFVRSKYDINSLVFDAEIPWPIANNSFQAVIMLDVLEHVKNDTSCLMEARRVLCHNGILIMTVPAHQFLFSRWDKILGHYRRYSKPQLYSILQEADFSPIIFSYQNALSLLPAIVLRLREKIFDFPLDQAIFPDVPKIINVCLKLWGRIEAVLIPGILPFGLSIIAVAQPGQEVSVHQHPICTRAAK